MKFCSKCKIKQDKSCFHKSNQTKDGLQGHCKKCRNKAKKVYRDKNRNRINAQAAEYYKKNSEKIITYTKGYYKNNIDKYNRWHAEYRKNPEIKKYKNNWWKKKYRQDSSFRLHQCFSSQIRQAINKNYKSSFEEIVPYSLQQLKEHLEKQFDDKMNWENYGSYWHIDHILPKSSFRFNNYLCKEFQDCWSLKNLRPLEKIENLRKGDR